MKSFWIILFIGIAFTSVNAQTAHKYLRKGDNEYKSQSYTTAEENYRKALEKERNAQGNYNLGNTIYQQGRYEEAIERYESAAKTASDNGVKARAYHNLGNTYFNQKQYERSIEAYKDALRLNPSDMETKINLAMAQKILQQQEPPPPEEQQQDPPQQQPPPDSPQQQQQQQQQGESEQQQEELKDLTKEEARKLLEIIDQEEQKVQQKLRKAPKPTKSKKDW
ncbi:MAG: tetratricopeptide repeat protein [Saprospiraceae bacterium]|nr:tetratricopeptide repeat protein [Saprospiraceae bacterium]